MAWETQTQQPVIFQYSSSKKIESNLELPKLGRYVQRLRVSKHKTCRRLRYDREHDGTGSRVRTYIISIL